MNDKRLTKSYKLHNEPQSSHCLVVHEDAHLSYKRYKVKKPCFHAKLHKYQYTHIHIVFVFSKIFLFLLKKKKKQTNKQANILKSNKN